MENYSEEEIKAIEILKADKEMLEKNYTFGKQAKLEMANDIEKVLNLIEKQQKEIEIHKDNFEGLSADITQVLKDLGLSEETIIADEMVVEIKNKFVSKDKIRDKIIYRQFELQQEYKDFKDDVRLNTLQEIYYIERK